MQEYWVLFYISKPVKWDLQLKLIHPLEYTKPGRDMSCICLTVYFSSMFDSQSSLEIYQKPATNYLIKADAT